MLKNSYRHQILVFITLPAGNNLFWFKWFGRKQQHSTGQDRMNINETYFYVFIGCSSLSAWVFGSCLKIRFIKSVSWLVSIIVVIYSLCFSRLDVKKKHILPYGGFPYTFVFIFLHQYSIFFTLNSFNCSIDCNFPLVMTLFWNSAYCETSSSTQKISPPIT